MFEPPPLKLKLSSHYLFEEEEEYITHGLDTVKRVKREEFHASYEIGEQIGEGTYSQVHLAKNKRTGALLACKIITKDFVADESRVLEEIKILSNISHNNIVKVHDVFETEEDILLLLDLATGGELFEKIIEKKRFSEPETKQIMSALIEAACFLHSQNVIHRDIKPENILLSSDPNNMQVLISDFGLAKILDENEMEPKVYPVENKRTRQESDIGEEEVSDNSGRKKRPRRPRAYTSCGSDCYVAPEILNAEAYGPKVDMWSIGVVMYTLLCGALPFSDAGNQLYSDIRSGNYNFGDPVWLQVSSNAKDLLKKLLTVDPEHRITAEQARHHPWLNGNKL